MLCEGCYHVRERGGSAPVMSWGGVRRWGGGGNRRRMQVFLIGEHGGGGTVSGMCNVCGA